MKTVALVYPACKIDLHSLFPNNVSILTQSQAETIKNYIRNHDCYKDYIKRGSELKKIEILSSSSRLANTGVAANKTFEQLSSDRANEIHNKIVSPLFNSNALTPVVLEMNFKGKNGDGTSGACPYAFDADRGSWKRKTYPSDAELESNKKTELNLYFNTQYLNVTSDVHDDEMTIPCRKIEFYCE